MSRFVCLRTRFLVAALGMSLAPPVVLAVWPLTLPLLLVAALIFAARALWLAFFLRYALGIALVLIGVRGPPGRAVRACREAGLTPTPTGARSAGQIDVELAPGRFYNGTILEPRRIVMPNLSIKNVPESVVQKLRERARRNHRSMQGEF